MGLYVTYNNELVDPEMFILLYMPLERAELVQRYLDEHNLAKKFTLIEGTLSTKVDAEGEREDDPISAPIKTLVLRMKNDKILFEYKLSNKHLDLQTKITDYVNGTEKES